MIHVNVLRNSNQQIEVVTIEGHAGSGPHGFDLVCAGVSSVTVGTMNAIEGLCGFEMNIEQGQDGGYLRCAFPNDVTESQIEKARWLLEGMLISLKTIETSYTEHIKLDDLGGGTDVEA